MQFGADFKADAQRGRGLRKGDRTTIDLRQQEDRKVKKIGDEFEFRGRNQLDEEEQRLMEKLEAAKQSARQSRRTEIRKMETTFKTNFLI